MEEAFRASIILTATLSTHATAQVMLFQIIINIFPYINRFLTARRHAGKRRPCAGSSAVCEWRIYLEEMRW